MPTYSFKDNNTGEEFDEFMGMSEKDKYLEDNPHISQVPVLFAFVGDHIMGVGPKTDGGFNERMEQIANSHPGSPLANRYGGGQTKSHKEIKTRNVLKKHKVI
jgi:hypothetical protein|tara:strand:+ start:2242 stop:2550 length:309 start_codon:yes stop_codon:yes gene_type:complete